MSLTFAIFIVVVRGVEVGGGWVKGGGVPTPSPSTHLRGVISSSEKFIQNACIVYTTKVVILTFISSKRSSVSQT